VSWPLSQDYNEAIQSPASNFSDADLKRGEAVCNGLGLPMPYSGNFADVYQVRCPDGSRWAVKCFTREAHGLRERYQEISAHLNQARLPFIVDFVYLEKGIRVAGKWHPALKMQWVEGLTLNQFVSKHLDKPAMLESLYQVWTRMATRLRAADVAHCDLQHGNILLVPGAGANSLALKLIDYDGMWTPALAKVKSGEVGHGNYQHPQRLREGIYNAEVDRFPLLLIATALRALTIKGKALWDKYDNGDNLLFKEADLQAPLKSFLFLDLTKVADPVVASLVDCLVKALRQGLDFAPLLHEVLREPTTSAPPRQEPPQPAPAPFVPIAPINSSVANNSASQNEAWYSDASSCAALTASPRTEGKRTQRNGAPIRAWIVAGVALIAIVAAVGSYIVMKSGGPDKHGMGPSIPQIQPVSGHDKQPDKSVAADGSAPFGLGSTREELIAALADPSVEALPVLRAAL
jgi:Protein kinase domain